MGLLVAIGTAVPMALVAWSGGSTLADLEEQLGRERAARAAALAGRVDHQVQEDLASLSMISSGPRFDPGDGDCGSERPLLHALRLRSQHLASVLVTGGDGGVLCEEPPPAAGGGVLGVTELAGALRTGRPTVSGLVRGPPPRVYLLAPFRDGTGRVTGAVAGAVDPASAPWLSLLGPTAKGPDGWAELIDARDAILASTNAGPMPAEARYVTAAATVSAASWRVVLRQPEGEAFAARRRQQHRILALAPALLAVALLFGWGAARSVTRPLAVLNQAASRIAAGDLSEPVPGQAEDEVGGLGRSLETMRVALRESMEAVQRDRNELERRVEERTRELAGLYEILREREQRRGQLLRKTISAQEDERKRIARELHDETCQALAALILSLHAASSAAAPAAEPVGRHLLEAKDLVARTLEEVHRLILDLRPSMLDDLGLLPALRWFAGRHLEPLGVAVRWEVEGLETRLPPEVETTLFRAVQEVLTNVARHAGAETVLVQIARREGVLSIEVEDDGTGFDLAGVAGPVRSERGLGLLGIRERLELLGGSAQIESTPGHGTRVVLRAPVEGPGDA